MQEVEVLTTLAEIAGVFVGFGALIAVRSGGPGDTWEVTCIRSVLSFGIWVVVAGLVPMTLGHYDLGGHDLWLTCGLTALVVFWGTLVVITLTPENRAERTRATAAEGVRMLVGFWPFVIVITGALLLVALGPFPDQEAALYQTAVVAGLFAAPSMLFMLVFSQGRPRATAPDQAEMPSGEARATDQGETRLARGRSRHSPTGPPPDQHPATLHS